MTGEQKSSVVEKTFSPAEVRKLLNSDNREIQHLCKEINVFPKKDNNSGKIFFLKSDVEVLKKVKDLYEKSQQIKENKKAGTALVESNTAIKPVSENDDLNSVMGAVISAREDIVKRLRDVIEEKLDGIDDVVVELIKSKVENERLRIKLEQLTKENHELMSDSEKYKSVGFGLYKKSR